MEALFCVCSLEVRGGGKAQTEGNGRNESFSPDSIEQGRNADLHFASQGNPCQSRSLFSMSNFRSSGKTKFHFFPRFPPKRLSHRRGKKLQSESRKKTRKKAQSKTFEFRGEHLISSPLHPLESTPAASFDNKWSVLKMTFKALHVKKTRRLSLTHMSGARWFLFFRHSLGE